MTTEEDDFWLLANEGSRRHRLIVRRLYGERRTVAACNNIILLSRIRTRENPELAASADKCKNCLRTMAQSQPSS